MINRPIHRYGYSKQFSVSYGFRRVTLLEYLKSKIFILCMLKMDDTFLPNDYSADVDSRNTRCGVFKWYPQFLQRFSNPRCFLLFFCLIGILQGAYFTYFVGILTTLEKRYSFDSRITAIILIADNLSPVIFGIFLGYFGKYMNKPKLVTFGTMFALRIIGPTLGFMLSSFCLQYYENPFIDPGLSRSDPKWVGAWWIGFIILGLSLFLVSFPVAFFPRHMNCGSTLNEDDNSFEKSVSDLYISLKKLMKNPILMFHTLSIVFQINGLFSYFVYMPKYMESQYRKTASSASLFSGTVTIIAMMIGVFLGGYLIHKIKPRPRILIGYMIFIEIFAGAILLSAAFMDCESTKMSSTHSSLYLPVLQNCSQSCNCSHHNFQPICDINGNIHFSPCFAGCQNYSMTDNKKRFHECSCVLPEEQSANFSATSGFCPVECDMFFPYLVIVTVAKMLSATARVGNVIITLRCVDEKDKTLALGAVEFMISIFATIPYPLLYGHVINKACVMWDESCGRQGNCWLYDNNLFRQYLHSLSSGFIFLAIICDFVVFIFSSKMSNLYGTNAKPVENLEIEETVL